MWAGHPGEWRVDLRKRRGGWGNPLATPETLPVGAADFGLYGTRGFRGFPEMGLTCGFADTLLIPEMGGSHATCT